MKKKSKQPEITQEQVAKWASNVPHTFERERQLKKTYSQSIVK